MRKSPLPTKPMRCRSLLLFMLLCSAVACGSKGPLEQPAPEEKTPGEPAPTPASSLPTPIRTPQAEP